MDTTTTTQKVSDLGQLGDMPSDTKTIIEEESSQQMALRLHNILEKLIENVAAKELTLFRLVNKIWWVNATSELIKRDCSLTLNIRHVDNAWLVQRGKVPKSPCPDSVASLNCFNDLVESSSKFPCTAFAIDQATQGNLNDPSIDRFLDLLGHCIKSLALASGQCNPISSKETLLNVLQKLPHLRDLDISAVQFMMDDFNPGDLSLPSIQRLVLNLSVYPDETAKLILGASTNLQQLQNFTPGYTDPLLQIGKSHIVTQVAEFGFMIEGAELEKQERFARINPKLVKFQFSYFEGLPDSDEENEEREGGSLERLAGAFKNILVSSYETLHEIEFFGFPSDVPSIFLVPLKIQKLSLGVRAINADLVPLPLGTEIDQIFPKVEILSVTLWGCILPPPESQDLIGQFPLVHTVTILDVDMNMINDLCPSFKQLNLSCDEGTNLTQEIPQAFLLWGNNLTGIDLTFNFGAVRFLPNFDFAFTGFSTEFMSKLNPNEAEIDCEAERVQPWIGHVTGEMDYLITI